MVHPSLIEARLGKLGFKASLWFRPEVRELEHVLMDNEEIVALACGRYFGSFAMLVATDQRLLLIDKRVFFMTVDDTRYDMISEVNYNSQVYNATVTVYTINKTHKFTTIKYKRQLRELTNYVQKRIMEIRHQQGGGAPDQQQPMVVAEPVPRPSSQAYQPVHTSNSSQPASPPSDYFVDDSQNGHHLVRGQVGHVSHLIGSAATRAAHSAATLPAAHRHANPYMQGSLMTRRPFSPGAPTTTIDY